MRNPSIRVIIWRNGLLLVLAMLSACQAAPAKPANCNPGTHSTMKEHYLTGSVNAGPVVGATVRLYLLEKGGKLSPVALDREVCTGSDGTYQTPVLPTSIDGKTLVIEASGGSFVDEASGKTFSLEGHSLYSVFPRVALGYPLGGAVTPLTDMAFRETRHDLSADPSLMPSERADLNNFWIAIQFGLGKGEGMQNAAEIYPPVNLYDGKPHNADDAGYALILAGLSQQAADAGISPVDWIAQLSADADNGLMGGTATRSASDLPAAIDRFLAGPRNPMPIKVYITPTIGP